MNADRQRRIVRVQFDGVTMPSWAAVALVIASVFSATLFLFGIVTIRDLVREVRVLQIHVQDIESALIDAGLVDRRNIAGWTAGDNQRPRDEEREK